MKRRWLGLIIVLTLVFSSTISSVLAQESNCSASVSAGQQIVVLVNWRSPYRNPNASAFGEGNVVPQSSKENPTRTVDGSVCVDGLTYVQLPGWMSNGDDGWLPEFSSGTRIWRVYSVAQPAQPTAVPTTVAGQDASQPSSDGTGQSSDCVLHNEPMVDGVRYVVVVNHNLFVRRQMGRDNTPIFTACVGSTFELIQPVHSSYGYWFKIRFNTDELYIAHGANDEYSMLVVTADSTEEPSMTGTPDPTSSGVFGGLFGTLFPTDTPVDTPCEAALPCQLVENRLGHNNPDWGETHVRSNPSDPDSQLGVVLTGEFTTGDVPPQCYMSPKHKVTICWWEITFTPKGMTTSVTAWAPEGIPGKRWLLLGPAS